MEHREVMRSSPLLWHEMLQLEGAGADRVELGAQGPRSGGETLISVLGRQERLQVSGPTTPT